MGKEVLVIGGSLSGIQTALDQASRGCKVYLLESFPTLSGEKIIADEDLASNALFVSPKWEEIKKNKNIQVITNSDLEDIREKDGKFIVKIKKRATRVIPERCDLVEECKECIKVCPVNMWDDYNMGLSLRTAIDYGSSAKGGYSIVKETPACQRTCPINLDIRGYIGLIADGKFKESLDLIREKLPFPASIGRICPHPCEEECNRGKVDDSLRIAKLKRFVADWEREHRASSSPEGLKVGTKKERVAIVGSGPAGLSCAHDLALLGYQITVFESLPVVGGMLMVGIPEYRLPKKILEGEVNLLGELGVEIKTSAPIGKDLTIDDLLKEGYKAIFIGVGAHGSRKLGVEGEDAKGVEHGVKFLRELNMEKDVQVGEKVAVIGGGNVAIDAARSSLRLGSKEVSIFYRRSRKEMPASDEEIDAAITEGIKIEYLVAPLAVLTSNGKVEGIKCVRMELGEPDASGRRRPVAVSGSEFDLSLDMIIPAIGQVTDASFLEDSGIEIGKGGILKVDPESLSTNRPEVFAGGDCVSGPDIAIRAVAAGKRAAIGIDSYLKGI